MASACLALSVLGTACRQREVHNHVAQRTQGLGQTQPSWVEEISRTTPREGDSRPHILLISLDTLRADHLGAWGYERPTSPILDELASSGVRFARTFSHSPKTAPSHMSVFTGGFPSDHGAHFEYTSIDGTPIVYPARRDLSTLPELMQDAGYRTAAWTGGGQVSRNAGFARGFDRFLENCSSINPSKMQPIRTWFRAHSTDPCFIFLHTYQIHDPYLPPPPYNTVFTDDDYQGWVIGDRKVLSSVTDESDYFSIAARFWRKTGWKPDTSIIEPADRQHLIDLYDGGIRYTDDVLRGFFEDLYSDGLLENTLVVVFSDHGEEFLEHGGVLHEMLYRETLHVPLIFFWPGHLPAGRVVEEQVPLMDLAPTLLELAGLPAPPITNARSLVPMIEEREPVGSRPVFSEAPWVHWQAHHRSFRDVGHMLYDRDHGDLELYDIEADPAELEELASEASETMIALLHLRMVDFLSEKVLATDGSLESAQELSEDEIEALRALGYVD